MTTATDIVHLSGQIDALLGRTAKLEEEVQRLEEAERAKWRWGVSALGAAVLGLAGIIWQYRGAIFRG